MRNRLARSVMAGASIVGGVVTATRDTGFGRAARRLVAEVDRRTRSVQSAWPGIRYRATGQHPATDVSDDVLADRVRSVLGRVERRLDLPKARVSVDDGVVTLHGAVGSDVDAHELEYTAHRVPGVRGVASYLHVGLGASDTRPSEGRTHQPPSPAYEALVDASCRAGAPASRAERCVRSVLGPFMERVPADEREHVLAHLPRDARALAQVPRRHGESRLRTVDDLDAEIQRLAGVDLLVADALRFTVLGALRALVPEEVADVAAVLPKGLRAAWSPEGSAGPAT